MAQGAPKSAEVVDIRDAAKAAGLRYMSDERPGIRRRRDKAGFTYLGPNGRSIRSQSALARIRKLAIPPAYEDVWICPHDDGHIQATGRDARGRKQYRYHARFREARDSAKYEHMMEFARGLPDLRARVATDMRRKGLPREKVLATVVYLLENTLIRVGNEDYARTNKSYGLTTLQDGHVAVDGAQMRFAFKGKSGKTWNLKIKDRRIARIVKECQDLPGQELFQYQEADGTVRDVSSGDVNQYLREITGREITAKDFRTWAGTVLAAMALSEFESFDSDARAKKNVRDAIERVSSRLGNTPTICRKCYVHPEILHCYMQGELLLEIKEKVQAELRDKLATLRPEEAAVLALLEGRLNRDLTATLRKAAAAA